MDTLIERSRASTAFKADVASFFTGERTERVKVETYAPRAKVQRLLTQLLAAEPSLDWRCFQRWDRRVTN